MVISYGEAFRKFVCDSAIDGVNKVLAENNERVSNDYKVMKKLRCKGGDPGLITIKVETGNPILDSQDLTKHETTMQKEIKATQAEGAKGGGE